MTVDPFLFSDGAIDDDTRKFVAELRNTLTGAQDPWKFPAPMLRAARERGESVFGMFHRSPRAVDRTIPGPAGPLTLRVIEPRAEPTGIYVHIHGGGWMLGAAYHQDVRLARMVDALGVVTVSVEYRLAPEDPYPAGPDDCEAAAVWLIENATAEFGTDRLMIGGESAGGHLSVATLLRTRDRHAYRDWVAANLVYGAFDLRGTPSTRNWGDENLVLSTPIIEWFNSSFVGDRDRTDPDISPLLADLSGMPPAIFTIGTLDPLLDDTLFMAERWAAAGNHAELAVYPGGVHAFDYWDKPLGRASDARVIEFLRAQLA
jgi:acetyl esterase/lipase